MVQDEAVEDTANVHRSQFRLLEEPEHRLRWTARYSLGLSVLVALAASITGVISVSHRRLVMMLAVPPVALTSLILVGLLVFGSAEPPWSGPQPTLAEAAYEGDSDLVHRLLAQGGDPNGPSSIRAGLFVERSVALSPLEAAVLGRNLTMVQFLYKLGRPLDRLDYQRLVCLARRSERPEIERYLEEQRPELAVPSCDQFEWPW